MNKDDFIVFLIVLCILLFGYSALITSITNDKTGYILTECDGKEK